MDQLVAYIGSIITLSFAEQQIVQDLFKKVELKNEEIFFREGNICNHLGFVTKGILRYYIDRDGDEQTYNFVKEGSFVCDYDSFIRRSPSVKSIQAIEASTVLCISYDDLQEFYKRVQEGERFGRLLLETVYSSTIRQLVSQYTESAEVRYEKFIHQFPDLVQRIPQYYVASYVGVKPQSLSRIRKRLARTPLCSD